MFAAKNELFTRPSGGYNLTRSLRFRSSASAYLNRIPATASNRKTWTYNAWVKRGALGSTQILFQSYWANVSWFLLEFESDNTLQVSFTAGSAAGSYTSAVFRDPAAWYMVTLTVDTTQATASNRVKLYINGTLQAFSSTNYPAQNFDTQVNNSVAHTIGGYTSSAFFDGYMAEVNFIDGQALAPTSFGAFSSYNQWLPIKYAGTYGTNGFYLPFTNNASTTTLGYDFSPQGNNWTTNNISVTAGSTYDSMTDVPTLTSATAANFAVLNSLTKASQGTIDNGNLHAYTGGLASIIAVATMQITGNTYWECVSVGNTNVVAGVMFGELPNVGSTWFPSASSYAMFVLGGALYTQNATASQSATPSWSAGNTLGFAWNNSARTLTLYVNNTLSSVMTITAPSTQPFPVFANYSSTPATDITANFGQQGFTYTPPSGFVALNTYNL
jgi:hypothetical protein